MYQKWNRLFKAIPKLGLREENSLERLRRGFGGEAWDLVARAEKCKCSANTGELVL